MYFPRQPRDLTNNVLYYVKSIGHIGRVLIQMHNKITYLGCILDDNLSGESMASKLLNKAGGRLNLLYRKESFLNLKLRRMLCNALIQPHFDYACSAWYPNLNKKPDKKDANSSK